jgi:hypothetical protein
MRLGRVGINAKRSNRCAINAVLNEEADRADARSVGISDSRPRGAELRGFAGKISQTVEKALKEGA